MNFNESATMGSGEKEVSSNLSWTPTFPNASSNSEVLTVDASFNCQGCHTSSGFLSANTTGSGSGGSSSNNNNNNNNNDDKSAFFDRRAPGAEMKKPPPPPPGTACGIYVEL